MIKNNELILNEYTFKYIVKVYNNLIKNNIKIDKIIVNNFLKSNDLFNIDYNCLDEISKNIEIKLDNYDYEEYRMMIDTIIWYKELINQYNLSPLEKTIYAYDIMKQWKYKKSEINEKGFERKSSKSRNPIEIIKDGYIVCSGYTAMLKLILDYMEGIRIDQYGVICYHENGELNGPHSRSIIRLDDNKYKIHGIFALDITWDSYKENYLYDGLDNYNYFLIPFNSEYYSVFPYDDIPSLMKDEEIISERINILNKKILKENGKQYTNSNLDKAYNLFDNRNKKEVLNYIKNAYIDEKILMCAIKNTRIAEGYNQEYIDNSIGKIKVINKDRFCKK